MCLCVSLSLVLILSLSLSFFTLFHINSLYHSFTFYVSLSFTLSRCLSPSLSPSQARLNLPVVSSSLGVFIMSGSFWRSCGPLVSYTTISLLAGGDAKAYHTNIMLCAARPWKLTLFNPGQYSSNWRGGGGVCRPTSMFETDNCTLSW